jgi:hypothetical protein
MLVCRHQAFVRAPARSVWDLLGEPRRHSDWWPELSELQGSEFGGGCSYCDISQQEAGSTGTTFVVEDMQELKELTVRCAETGLYMRWLLTAAQDGTFVDAEFGIQPERASQPGSDRHTNKDQLRRWLQSSLEGLAEAAQDLELDGRRGSGLTER